MTAKLGMTGEVAEFEYLRKRIRKRKGRNKL